VRSLGDAALAYKPSRGASFAAASLGGTELDLRLPQSFGEALSGRRLLQEIGSSDLQQRMDAQLDLTSALRAGLDDNRLSVGTAGLSLGLPPGVNPFDYFADLPTQESAAEETIGTRAHRQDVPEMQMALESEDALSATPAGMMDDLRIARMVQTMAAFGRSTGEAEWQNRDRDAPRFEYFA
jgi:hypothetical protein